MKEWTVMLYLAGDNNLSGEMANTLEQIKSVTDKNENIDLFVYFDGSSRNVPTLYCDFTDRAGPIKYFRSFNIKDKLIERESRRVFNENSASMNNVINFIDWCVKKDKHAVGIDGAIIDRRLQKRYALIFSGHSFGFHDWGLLKDDASNYYMTLSKLRWLFERITFPGEILRELAVTDQERETRFSEKNGKESRPWSDKKVLERTTEILGRRLDLLGFDSCEMSSLEIASQFFGLADAMVASEGTVPN